KKKKNFFFFFKKKKKVVWTRCIASIAGSIEAPDVIGTVVTDWVVYVVYALLHSTLLYVVFICFNVMLNSPLHTIITLLVSNNFTELKTFVFKRYHMESLFQVLCADICERFELVFFALLIAVQNVCFLGGLKDERSKEWLIQWCQSFVLMLGLECFVDTIKHGFMLRFNDFTTDCYRIFALRLSLDVTSARRMLLNTQCQEDPSSGNVIERRLGFCALPYVALFSRVMCQVWEYNSNLGSSSDLHSAYVYVACDARSDGHVVTGVFHVLLFVQSNAVLLSLLGIVVFACGLKFLLSLLLVGKATQHISHCREQDLLIAATLENTSRFQIVSKNH
ncbi:DUF747 family protein, partial [Reticulomyxa filosa]